MYRVIEALILNLVVLIIETLVTIPVALVVARFITKGHFIAVEGGLLTALYLYSFTKGRFKP